MGAMIETRLRLFLFGNNFTSIALRVPLLSQDSHVASKITLFYLETLHPTTAAPGAKLEYGRRLYPLKDKPIHPRPNPQTRVIVLAVLTISPDYHWEIISPGGTPCTSSRSPKLSFFHYLTTISSRHVDLVSTTSSHFELKCSIQA